VAPTVSIVIPAFDEERRLPRLLEALRTAAPADMEAAGLELLETVVVDDGSTDGTAALLARAADGDARLRSLPAPGGHAGKGHAVAAGVRASRGELVLIADVDLSAPLRETAALGARLRAGADVAIGSRALAGARVDGTPRHRELMGRAFNLLVRAATGMPFHDTQCPLKLMPASVARTLLAEQLVPGFAFDVELLLRARRAGLRVDEVPVEFHHDHDSRVGELESSARMAGDLGRLVWRLRVRGAKPLGGPARQVELGPEQAVEARPPDPPL
jgi:glycosyltransferase involved in cell wall biosynthesis